MQQDMLYLGQRSQTSTITHEQTPTHTLHHRSGNNEAILTEQTERKSGAHNGRSHCEGAERRGEEWEMDAARVDCRL